MKKKIPGLNMVCKKCGKEQEPDKKESNENWKVYPNIPCECGGVYLHLLVITPQHHDHTTDPERRTSEAGYIG